MSNGFDGYKEELDQVKLTRDSKRALVQALAEREIGTERTVKRPSKRIRAVLAAAVLALGALVLLAAARPGFWTMLGGHSYEETAGSREPYLSVRYDGRVEPPVEVADGRVWFIFDGQHIDITGQFDDQNAYVYETTNPETGLPDYILVGWSAGGIGFGEIVIMPEEVDDPGHAFAAQVLGYVNPDVPVFDHTYPVSDSWDFNSGDWFTNAVEEICAPYLAQIRPPEGTYETQPPMTDTAAPDMAAVLPGP